MRKTSATQANRITGDFYAVSKNLGHSSLDETQKYVEEVDEGKWKVARALDEVARAVLAAPLKAKEIIGGAEFTPPVPQCLTKEILQLESKLKVTEKTKETYHLGLCQIL